jgi:hypothetical protein
MTEPCRHEPQVRRAASENRWTDALREHVATCAECAAAAAAAPFMTRLAHLDERLRKLPDPAVVWLKAQLFRGNFVAARAARPLNIVQMMAYGIVAAGWAAVLTWKWTDLQRWLLSFTPARLMEGVSSLPVTFLLTVVVLATLTVMLGLHTILAEE